MTFEQQTELQLLEALEAEPETTQADLAARAGVAVGTVNWYLKRWSSKGFVVVKRINRWRWRYLLTPQGMAEKGRLATKYVEASMWIYRHSREQAKELLQQVQSAGYDEVVIDGDGDIADVCRLTCLEYGLKHSLGSDGSRPLIIITGYELDLLWPEALAATPEAPRQLEDIDGDEHDGE